MKLEFVSFTLCPYVQRAAILLNAKAAPFTVTYIDLDEPPAWFDAISPLGQVPLLKVDEKTVLFESAVICEYLDEVTAPSLHPQDPLLKAQDRAWIEFASHLLRLQYTLFMETDRSALGEQKSEFFSDLKRVEDAFLSSGPFWRGDQLGMVDAAWAPIFMRLRLIPALWSELERQASGVMPWARGLLDHQAVRASVKSNFEQEYLEYLRKNKSALLG